MFHAALPQRVLVMAKLIFVASIDEIVIVNVTSSLDPVFAQSS